MLEPKRKLGHVAVELQFKLTEATSKLSLSWAGSPSSVDLLVNDNTKVGSFDAGSGLLTFSDGSYMSLDLGL